MGRQGVMSETNPALQRMLGYTGDELKTMHYTDVTHPDDRALTVQYELDDARRESFSIAKRYVRKDGSEVETHVNVALDLADGLGVSLIEDVSHKRELEDQLRHSQKMEAVGKLAGGVAHDFNNLMTAVIGYSDLLLGQVEDDRQLAKLGAIRDSAVRASELTRQLLAFGRRQVLQVEDVDLRDVVVKMEGLLQRLVGEEIELQTVCGGEAVLVRADRAQLEQVMLSLVGNARDAMPTGGKLIVAVLSDGTDGILSVSDNGIGMDEALQARIFEPFFTTKPVGAGSGLGLASVDGIVGQSGGSLGVESAPGSGTTVVVRLPLARPDEPAPFADSAALPVGLRAATLVD
ncbi:MAG: PAS domain S-box protein [Actinobacteria bacterium]|nr:PAS domain S-box protein [Actinomycetota bacterium]